MHHLCFLFGVTPGVDFFFRAILEQIINKKMVRKIQAGMSIRPTIIYLH